MKPTLAPSSSAVDVRNLSFHYPDGTLALDQLSIHIPWGEVVCLAGPNGAGKSTLMLALAGLIRGDGQVNVAGSAPAANSELGLVFQDPDDQLFCSTILDDVAFGPRNQGQDEDETAARVAKSLTATGLSGFETRHAHHLSGGEKKRAAIAAVLACCPRILALDEPWANLDARGARAVTAIIREFEGTCIVSSQDLYHAAEVCSRFVLVDDGRVVADGPTDQILSNHHLLDEHGLEFGYRCRYCPSSSPERPAP